MGGWQCAAVGGWALMLLSGGEEWKQETERGVGTKPDTWQVLPHNGAAATRGVLLLQTHPLPEECSALGLSVHSPPRVDTGRVLVPLWRTWMREWDEDAEGPGNG